jgi:hypothetical protein
MKNEPQKEKVLELETVYNASEVDNIGNTKDVTKS